jgi:hypothetical protein
MGSRGASRQIIMRFNARRKLQLEWQRGYVLIEPTMLSFLLKGLGW